MRLARLLLGLLVALALVAPAQAAPPPFGGLTPLPGTSACVSPDGTGGACAVGRGLNTDGYPTAAMSPDGKNFYGAEDDGPGVVAVFARDAGTGALTQLPGADGCVSNDGTDGNGGPCDAATGIGGAAGVAVSPDGRNVYVAAKGSDAVTAFSRDPATGALTQVLGSGGCVSDLGAPAGCVDGAALNGARSVAVSPDGAYVYVASADAGAISVFSRDPVGGGLTQLPGADGCIKEGGGDGCVTGEALAGARDVAVSADGGSIYVAAEDSDAVDTFQRLVAPAGALDEIGCVAQTAAAGCTPYSPLRAPRTVAVSPFPDASSVYVTALNTPGIVAFSRGLGGMITPLPGTDGCVTEDGSSGACADGQGLADANGVAVSPDGRNVYVASINTTGAVAVFGRDPSTGALAQLPGTAGCLSGTGAGGDDCVPVTSINSPNWVTPSPDGRHVYVVSTGLSSVTAFSRELPPVCTSGSVAVQPGKSSDVPLPCSDPNGDPIVRSIASAPAHAKLGALNQIGGSVLYTPTAGFLGSDSFTFRASDGSLSSEPATASLTVRDTVSPLISRASISPRKFAPAGPHAARVRRGTKIRYRLSEKASVTFTVQRKRKRRWVKIGSFKQRGKAGRNTKPFSGRVHRKALKPGAYRLVMRATDPSRNRSKQRRLGFRIVRAR